MPDFDFSKSDRILKRSEYLFLSKFGKKLHNKYFIALFCPGQNDRIRLGVTVSKKVGHAVQRNRIKRLIRECFRIYKSEMKGFWDINIVAKKQTTEMSATELFKFLKDIFDKIQFK